MSHPSESDDALLLALGGAYRAREIAADADWPNAALPPIQGADAEALFERVMAESQPTTPSNGVPFFRRRAVAGLVALAAGLLLLVWLSADAPLPAYEMTVRSGDKIVRGAHPQEGVARYTPGSRVLLILRPGEPVQGVRATLYLRQAGRSTRVEAPVQISQAGAVRIDLVAGETLPMRPGDGELIVLIHPEGHSGDAAALLRAADPRPARRLIHRFTYRR
jgi:hypothetical protein